MIEKAVGPGAPLDSEIAAAATLCGNTLQVNFAGLVDRIPAALKSPESCFEVLSRVPDDRGLMNALRQLAAEELGSPHTLGLFIVLQSYLIALPRLLLLPVDESVKRQFIATCRQVASPFRTGGSRLEQDSDAFGELAKIVTLRRFHAGELSFDIMKMPRTWLLRVHPIDLPNTVREIVCRMGGFGPVVIPHVNYWRRNPMIISRREHERAVLRIGKSIEKDRDIKGLVSASWLYSKAVGEHSPHLGWLRDFFVDRKAYVVDLGPALAESGILIGSEKRRQLYGEGVIHPREALILWRRADIMEWISSDFALREMARPYGIPLRHMRRSQPPTRQKLIAHRILRNGRHTLIDCKRLLFHNPRQYIVAILLLPALCGAFLATIIWTAQIGCLAFFSAIVFMWLFQYFLLQ
jgi:hypothetical protein